MTTLSNADTIQPDDEFTEVKVVLYVTVNKSAYRREYDEWGGSKVSEMKRDIRESIHGAVGSGSPVFSEGIIHNVTLA